MSVNWQQQEGGRRVEFGRAAEDGTAASSATPVSLGLDLCGALVRLPPHNMGVSSSTSAGPGEFLDP